MKPTWEEIERAILARQTETARRLLQGELKRASRDPDRIFRVCEGFRRLGLYEEGLKALDLDSRGYQRKQSTRQTEGRKLLWAARFLNLLGASTFSRSLAEWILPETCEDFRILANLYLSYYEPERALPYFERMRELDTAPESYASRVALLSFCDALADNGQLTEALAAVADLQKRSPEPLLQAITGQARGEFLARSGRMPEALIHLEASILRFPPGDTSPDFAIACKWLGHARLKLAKSEAQRQEGRQLLKKAFDLLYRPDLKPEAWLDVLLLHSKTENLDETRQGTLLAYPVCATAYLRELARPEVVSVGSTKTADRHIDLARDESHQAGAAQLGVSKELHLLALARLASPLGLNPVTAKALLWPDEAYSYPQLEERLKKLLGRLRKHYGMELKRQDGWILLADKTTDQVAVTIAQGAEHSSGLRPSFFASLPKGRTEIAPSEVDTYYGIARSQRAAVLKAWIQKGWITSVGAGRGQRYRIAESAS